MLIKLLLMIGRWTVYFIPTRTPLLGEVSVFNWVSSHPGTSQVALVVMNPPANAGDLRDVVPSLNWEDSLEEGMQPTPVFLPGESHGQRSLASCSPWDCKVRLESISSLSVSHPSIPREWRGSWNGFTWEGPKYKKVNPQVRITCPLVTQARHHDKCCQDHTEEETSINQWASFTSYDIDGLLRWRSGKESTCQCRRRSLILGWEDTLEKEMATHSSKMMLLNCCTQYASKFGKLTSGHKTGKGQFPLQSQRRATPKNAQTTAQLHSSHMLAS